jgi:hypothetical protein
LISLWASFRAAIGGGYTSFTLWLIFMVILITALVWEVVDAIIKNNMNRENIIEQLPNRNILTRFESMNNRKIYSDLFVALGVGLTSVTIITTFLRGTHWLRRFIRWYITDYLSYDHPRVVLTIIIFSIFPAKYIFYNYRTMNSKIKSLVLFCGFYGYVFFSYTLIIGKYYDFWEFIYYSFIYRMSRGAEYYLIPLIAALIAYTFAKILRRSIHIGIDD